LYLGPADFLRAKRRRAARLIEEAHQEGRASA
jgi:hypothetical protein